MQQKTNMLMMIIVALMVFIVTREVTLYQARSSYPQEKSKGSDGSDPYEKDQIKNTLTKSTKSFQECYLAYLKEKPTKQSVSTKIDWQIQGTGKTSDVGVIFTESELLSSCLVGKLEEVQFPPPPEGRPYYVAHHFQFKTVEQLESEKKQREEMEKKYQPQRK